ncbi:hypothetical protein B0H14DRAFT_2850010 [Mycena olivaceomarginata]|nr:hypothetical protein B0H14DRAFT_2850010 [Mycena olivaceomarginata]
MSRHDLLAAVEDQIRALPFSLLSPAIAPKIWLSLDSPTALQTEELLRVGRQALIVLYFDFMESRTLPLGAYDTIYQIVFAQRTYQLILQHTKLPMGTVHSAPICAQAFYLWVAALRHSLEPSHFVAWFRLIFGSLIASVERVIKAQDFDLEDGTDADQRPAKKTADWLGGKIYQRPANNVDNTGTKPRTGRVRQAAATIMRKSSASSSSKFAPILDPMPPKMPKMPGAWPPTPQRPRHVVNDKSASFFRFRRTSYTNYRPPHFCPLN